MLVELRLENYALIDNLAVEFASGLNLLTGETGAGKSILIDALTLLLGEKASSDVIRSGAERCVISALFEMEDSQAQITAGILADNGLDSEPDSLILRREIAPAGKGRVFINNQPATVAVLRLLGPHLATVHAQNETLAFFDGRMRLALLDSFAGSQVAPVSEAFAKWRDIRARITDLEHDEQERLRLLDLWKYQKQEIEQAKPQPGEDQRLESEKSILANADKIYNAAMNAFDLLYEGDSATSATLRSARKHIEELTLYEPRFGEALATLESARISVEDVGQTVRDYAGGVQVSPERLAEVEDRLAQLHQLKRKYGPGLEDVLNFATQVAGKISEMENKDEVLRRLQGELAAAAAQYLALARALSKKRQDAARKLETLVEAATHDLAMKATFRIELARTEREENWSAAGFDDLVYLISANPGEPLGRLERTASGGELARLMLALKASVETGGAAALKNSVGGSKTLVFDEIDAGIGGRAAEAVGRKLKQLAASNQVLCVTHLPQIASFADHHYLIEKLPAGGRTRMSVRHIAGAQRTEEIARMLSGAKVTESSLRHAEQMLKTGR